MALKGSFNTTAYDGRCLTFAWTATQDTATNTSTISWTLTGAGGNNQYYKASDFKVVIAGETVYNSATRISLYKGTNVASGTKKIQHNSDGKKSFTASAEAAIYYYDVNCKGSGTFELDAIPVKASFVSAPDFTDEQNPTITYSNPTGSNADDLLACITNGTGSTILVPYRSISKTGTSYTFNLTAAEREALWSASPNSSTMQVRFYLRTVIGGTNHHSYTTKTLTIVNAAPTVEVELYDVNMSTVAATGNDQTLVKGASMAYFNIIATPRKGATITAYGATNGEYSKNEALGTFFDVESGEFEFTVVDSRGYIQGVRKSLTVIDYAMVSADLSIDTDIEAGTSNLAVSLSANGTFYVGSFSASSINTLELYYQYKIGNGEYGELIRISNPNVSADTNSYNAMAELTLDYREAYTFRVLAKNRLYSRYSKEVAIVTKPVFDWSKEDFNFNVPVSFNGVQMVDFVVEQGTDSMGTNGTWYWQKWASGKAECYGLRNYGNMGVSSAFGGLYRSAAFQQSLPSGLFASAPECCNINYAGSSSDWAAFIMPRLPATTSNSCGFYVMRPESGTISQAKISFHILGRWK